MEAKITDELRKRNKQIVDNKSYQKIAEEIDMEILQ